MRRAAEGQPPFVVPTSIVRLARAHIVLALLGLVAGGAGAIWIRAELWSAGMDGTAELYRAMLALHARSMLGVLAPAAVAGFGALSVAELSRAHRVPAIWLSALGLCTWVAGAVLQGVVVLRADFMSVDALTPLAIALALGALGMGLTAAFFAAVLVAGVRARSGAVSTLAITSIVALLWGSGAHVLRALQVASLPPEPLSSMPVWDGSVLVAIGAIAVHAVGRSLASEPYGSVPAPALFVATGMLPCGWLALGALAFAQQSPDAFLADTYFALGTDHLIAGVLLCAVLATLLAWSDVLLGRRPHPTLARAGCILVSVGMIATSIAMLLLGARGMPQGYADYLPSFELHHRVLGALALVTVTGVSLLAGSLVVGRRVREAASSERLAADRG